jgi:hypothetical protein
MDTQLRAKRSRTFRLPSEYGAWWTFEICLLSGWIKASTLGEWRASLSLAAGMQALFLASEWITGLARWRRRASWIAWQGWLLCGAAAGLLGAGLYHTPDPIRMDLAQCLAAWALLSALVLNLRIRVPARDVRLMMASAVLLTGPTLVLGVLAFGGLGLKALAYWGLWAWFFPWGVFYIQTWLRGTTLPRWTIAAASLPFFLEAALLAWFERGLATALLALLCVRIAWRLRLRWVEYQRSEAPPRLCVSCWDMRLLGCEELAWSLVLYGIWTLG